MHPTPARPRSAPARHLVQGLDRALETLVQALGLAEPWSRLEVRVDTADVEADLRYGR